MSISITRLYLPTTFKPGQIQKAFRKLPDLLKVDKTKCSLSAKFSYTNGTRQDKDIDWKDLDTICEITSDSLYCLLFSYFPRNGGSCIIYLESRHHGELFMHCVSPHIDTASGLVSILEHELSLEPLKGETPDSITRPLEGDYISVLENICSRFHLVVRQMKSRHADRETLIVNDEYDTQDLLHTLLHLYFDDIRPEEWTPSYAGGSSRVDFLLKEQSIIIEVKKTRQTLTAKKIGDELLIDIQRYQVHPDCKYLICFVYDPEGWISNPTGLENDLSQQNDKFVVKVMIAPKGY